MKKVSAHLFAFLFLSLIPLISYAGCSGNSCSSVYVDKLYVNATSSAKIYIGTSGDESLLDCEAHANVYVTLDSSQANADKIYSTLLAAQLANKTVRIRVDTSTAGCKVSYITLDRQ